MIIQFKARSYRYVLVYALLFLAFSAVRVSAQSSYGFQLVRGAITGYSKVNYRYTPTILQFESFSPVRKNLDFVVQRQLNFATFEDTAVTQTAWEAGLNVGVMLHGTVGGVLKVYALGSTGPHYVSDTPKRQAQGFIFSDNFRTGILVPVTQNFGLDLCAGIRHVSNAGLKRPNKGLDNIMVGLGLKYRRGRMK